MAELFIKLFNMSISASWLVLAVLFLRMVLKSAPKAIRCVLWGLVVVRLVCPFSIESIFSLLPSAETIPQEIMQAQKPVIHSGIAILNSYVNATISQTLAPTIEVSINPMQRIIFTVTAVWIAGMIVMIIYGLSSYLRLRQRICAGVYDTQKDVWLCDYIDTPFILGVFRPRIYLPSNILDEDEVYVIAHEKAHLKRLDHWWKLLGFGLLTVYWFNPVMWVAYILFCRDMELACDEHVVKEFGAEQKKQYSEALINCSISHKMISACPLAFGEVGVKRRIKNVLHYKKPAFWITALAGACCIVAAVCFLTDPADRVKEPDLSFLNYENAISLVADREKVMVIWCPVTEKGEDGKIRIGEVSGKDLAIYLDNMEWKPSNAPRTSLHSPGSVDFVIADEHRIQVYKRQEGDLFAYAFVQFGAEKRYYRVGYRDYEAAVEIVGPPTMDDSNSQSETEEISMDIWGESVIFQPETVEYFCQDSPDIFTPRVRLDLEEKSFSFSISALSSQMPPSGTYEMTDTALILTANNESKKIYVFQNDGEKYIFDETKSAPMPKYNYGKDLGAQSPVPDGAVFEPVVVHLVAGEGVTASQVIDGMMTDIDGDGNVEISCLSYGQTSGIFTFQFDIKEYGSKELEYSNIFTTEGYAYYDFSFFVDGTGAYYLRGRKQGKDIEEQVYRISFEEGNIVLTKDGTTERLTSKKALSTE